MDDEARRIDVFRQLLLVTQQLRYVLDRSLETEGLTASQTLLLTALAEQGEEPPSLTEVAEYLASSHQNVKQLAVLLEKKGFLHIEVDAKDRRVRRLRTTARCHAFWAHRDRETMATILALFQDVPAGEMARFHRALSDIGGRVAERHRALRDRSDAK